MKKRSLNRMALSLAILGILLCLPSVASQIGIIPSGSNLWYATIALSITSGILWCVALCFLSKARGYNPLWGLVLLFPPMILIYTILFPDKNIDDGEENTGSGTMSDSN
jgi:hypothetical protein